MKSETTKTNVPAGKLDACRTSASEAAVERRRSGGSRVGTACAPRRARGPSAAGRPRASVVVLRAARRRRARRRRQLLRGRSTRSRPRWPPACRARAAVARRAPSAAAGRRRARPAEPCRRRTRGRRTRRCPARPRGAPTRASRSTSAGRPVGTAACPRPRLPGRAVGSDAGRSERRRTACAGRGRRDARPRGSLALRVPPPPPSSAPAVEPARGRLRGCRRGGRSRSHRCRSARRPTGSAGGRRRDRRGARCPSATT